MKRVGAILILSYILVNTLSLSLQDIYKNYFCMDTKEYLSIAGRQITVCGQTCDFDIQEQESGDSNFVFNHNAPPLFYQMVNDELKFGYVYVQNDWHYFNHYRFSIITNKDQPPQA